MPAPTNLDALTATELGPLPNTIIQDVRDGGGNYTVWYKYTAQAGDNEIGLWAFGALSPGYQPRIFVYDGPAASPTPYPASIGGTSIVNRPIQVSVVTGTTYYFEISSSTGNTPDPAVLTLSALVGPNDVSPLGSFLISDDEEGLPASLLSSTDGSVLNFFGFASGSDYGSILNNGIMLFPDTASDELWIYDTTLTLIIAIAPATTGTVKTASNKVDLFYIGDAAGHIFTVDATGAIGDDWTLPDPGLTVFCPSNDDTVLYLNGQISSVFSNIKVWDLVNNVFLTDLAATVSGYLVSRDILVLDDDSIIVGYVKTTTTKDFYIKRYDAAGSVLNTYSFGATYASTGNRFAYALDDPNSFWVWFKLANSISRFRNIKVSDGSTLASFDVVQFENGAYQGVATTSPTALFGHSSSCPFLVIREEIPAHEPPEFGSIIVNKVTIPSDSTTSFDFIAGGGLSPSTFTLANGESQEIADVLFGEGYSVIETDKPDWMISYEVSSGTYDDIVVSTTETVIVTVTNTFLGPFSGVYFISPGKTNDTVYNSIEGDPPDTFTTEVIKIPNPFIIL